MKTAPISVKIRRIFERDARTWPAKLVRRHFMCAERQENHQRLLVLRVPHVQRAFRADFRRFCSEKGTFLQYKTLQMVFYKWEGGKTRAA